MEARGWIGGATITGLIAAAREYIAHLDLVTNQAASQESYQALLEAFIECTK